ncbi:MAG: hypothetical protein K0S41_1853 [Anaerocolumna sp.]|jgi:hypothetical protein|nr:hypothetical protein [Anaerocolumna sp.]
MGRRFKNRFGDVVKVRKLFKGTLKENAISRDIKKLGIEFKKPEKVTQHVINMIVKII